MKYIEEENRIYVMENNILLAEILFKKVDNDTYDIYHTFVDVSLRGRGIASELVRRAYEYIMKKNCKVVASCSYAQKWLKEKNVK